jgi:hypothetical protein
LFIHITNLFKNSSHRTGKYYPHKIHSLEILSPKKRGPLFGGPP